MYITNTYVVDHSATKQLCQAKRERHPLKLTLQKIPPAKTNMAGWKIHQLKNKFPWKNGHFPLPAMFFVFEGEAPYHQLVTTKFYNHQLVTTKSSTTLKKMGRNTVTLKG